MEVTEDVGLFRYLRGLINSTVNEPEFSLKNFWKRGGYHRIIREAFVILIIVILKILVWKNHIKSDWGIRAFVAVSLFIACLHLFMVVFSIGSHIKMGKGGWRWIKWNKFTGEICFEKYYPPIALSIICGPPRNHPFYLGFREENKREPRWERGLKWKMWYAFLNFLVHIIRAMFILFV